MSAHSLPDFERPPLAEVAPVIGASPAGALALEQFPPLAELSTSRAEST